VAVQERSHHLAAERRRASCDQEHVLGACGERGRQQTRRHPGAVPHAGQLGDDFERLQRGERRTVEHVAGAWVAALGRQQMARRAVGDIDQAQVCVDEDLEPAVEIGDQDAAGAA
jgi:hypothetical protein